MTNALKYQRARLWCTVRAKRFKVVQPRHRKTAVLRASNSFYRPIFWQIINRSGLHLSHLDKKHQMLEKGDLSWA